jgi:hypothetical protein
MGAQVSKVVSLSDRPIRNEPNPEVIAELQRLLELAQNGQVVGLAWIALQPDSRPDIGWTAVPDGMSYGLGMVGLTYKYGQGAWEE